MKREELEKHMGKIVEITLFDGDVIKGELHKTREERFKNEPNLYVPNNYYFLINPQSCIFKCSHVKKLNGNITKEMRRQGKGKVPPAARTEIRSCYDLA